MDLDKYLREQLKILDGKPAQYYGAVEKQQRRLYREIQDLLDNLQTDDAGNVLTNARNYGISEQINTRLQQAFYNEDYINAVDSFASGFDQSATLNKQWLTGVLGAELTPDITRTADLLIQRQKRNAVDLLVSTSAIDSSFFAPINNTLIESISTGESIKELNRNIRNTILGNDQYDGRLLSYSKQIANDTIATGDRNYMFEMSKNADIEFYRYSGGTISDTREFCQTRNGGYFHKKEVQQWGDPNKSPKNWQGRYRGTNSVTIFTWCGGYNCRHSLIPVSAISVPKDWLNRAIAKGYYKPNKEIQNELGVDASTAKDSTKTKRLKPKQTGGFENLPNTDYKQIKTKKGITEAVKKNYAQPNANVNLKSFTIEQSNVFNEQLERLTTKYPTVKLDEIKSSTATTFGGKANGMDYIMSSEVYNKWDLAYKYNQMHPPRLEKYTRGIVPYKYKDPDKAFRLMMNHEYGHVLADQKIGQINGAKFLNIFKRSYNRTYGVNITTNTAMDMVNKNHPDWQSFKRLFSNTPARIKVIEGYANNNGSYYIGEWERLRKKYLKNPNVTKRMSEYAFSNGAEFFAESFSMYTDPVEFELLPGDVIDLMIETLNLK